ncbi:MAG: VPLPA-CTERM-specific exosortase XrtD [Alphaproteobacteria bacterium]|nr:VPLPA-CTERM-specific exosortase XrtD [Alphaproteobacteria bacterium]
MSDARPRVEPARRAGGNAGSWFLTFILAIAGLGIVFWDGLVFMAEHWDTEEYSHGSLIPIIAAFLVWQQKDALQAAVQPDGRRAGAAVGVGVVLFGLFAGLLGELSTVYLILQYGFLVTIYGAALSLVGWRGLRLIWAPLLYLVFMVPLPSFLYVNLSAELQLISSQIGVAVIRLFGIPVFLEGNVIDLGIYKLQVVEACSGLRYLFPLMSFGYLCAYLYRGPLWHRGLLFAATIPITIFMNSIRIGVIGILVDRWGIEQAEGALHLFEGWVVFMVCVAILFAGIVILNRFSRERRPLAEMFRIDLPDLRNGWVPRLGRAPGRAWIVSALLLATAGAASLFLADRSNLLPPREELSAFPLRVGDWHGQRRTIEPPVLRTLKLTDYALMDFINSKGRGGVNYYVAYYESQRKGEAVHSPRSCIPGDGWQIEYLGKTAVDGVTTGSGKLIVNRVVIAKGETRQVVYYWFAQRGRHLTNEYLVKWYLFWDGLTRNRTDGALVRLVTPLGRNEPESAADGRLGDFLRDTFPILNEYVPD